VLTWPGAAVVGVAVQPANAVDVCELSANSQTATPVAAATATPPTATGGRRVRVRGP